MTKHEEYNLIFDRAILSNGITKRFIDSAVSDNPYAPLTFMNSLDQTEIQYFIDNITLANNNEIYDTGFYNQQGTEAFSIQFSAPNFNIEGLSINMADFQSFLKEWLTYLNS